MKNKNSKSFFNKIAVVFQLINISVQIKHFDQGKGVQSPMNIEYPITYTAKMIVGFDFTPVENPTITRYNDNIYIMQKNDANNKLINGAFGKIQHMGTEYNLWQVVFMSKSAHKVGGRRLAMEMHVRGTPVGYEVGNNDYFNVANDLVFVVLFEKSNPDVPFTELYNANIGSGQLKLMTNYNEDMQLSSMKLSTTFNLNNVWSGYDKFLSYEGTDFLHHDSPGRDNKHPPRPVTYVIMFQTLWISKIQLEEFTTSSVEYKIAKRRKNTRILSNFEVYKKFDIEQLKDDAKLVAAKIEEAKKKKQRANLRAKAAKDNMVKETANSANKINTTTTSL